MTAQEILAAPNVYRVKVEDYLLLDRSGAFDEFAKTELIEGVIVAMNAQYSTHARVKTLLLRRIADKVDACMPGFEAWSEASVSLGPDTMPEPDILVTSFKPADRTAVPAETVALIVEVADTTQRYDLGAKAALYARFGIPEYWVLDVSGRLVHQMWMPESDDYTERREVAFGERIEAATIAGLEIETSGLS